MSRSELTFDTWIAAEFARTGGFTALVVLVEIGDLIVAPLRSTWFHVIGTDTGWAEVAALLSGPGPWDGALFAPRTARDGGPLADAAARIELRDLADRVIEDRTVLNEEHFFDRLGRRMRVDEVPVQ